MCLHWVLSDIVLASYFTWLLNPEIFPVYENLIEISL
jgi:hypothetical protein